MDFPGTQYDFMDDRATVDFDEEIQKLPYVFQDTHKLDKKIDPKKLLFGSKIDRNNSLREEYFSVKEVISPELIMLSNGSLVRLIGVRENKALNGLAMSFLVEKTKGQKIFLKYDLQKRDHQDRLMCYVYLKNKTFLNAHLIKEGLAMVDRSIDFRFKDKFLKLEAQRG